MGSGLEKIKCSPSLLCHESFFQALIHFRSVDSLTIQFLLGKPYSIPMCVALLYICNRKLLENIKAQKKPTTNKAAYGLFFNISFF